MKTRINDDNSAAAMEINMTELDIDKNDEEIYKKINQ